MVSGPTGASSPYTGLGTSTSPYAVGSDLVSTMIRNNQLLLEVNQLEQQILAKRGVTSPPEDLAKSKKKNDSKPGELAPLLAANGQYKPLTAEELKAQQQGLEQAQQQLMALKAQETAQARQAIANVEKTLSQIPNPSEPGQFGPGSALNNYPTNLL